MNGPEDPRPGYDWDSYCAARERFFARLRLQATPNPTPPSYPQHVPEEWTATDEGPQTTCWE
jgi:hypothetical protein